MFRSVAATLSAFALGLVLIAQSAQAEGRTHLGYGRLITNDYIGDGQDRWRSGAWTSSRIWGSDWNGQAPAAFGDLIELRLSAEIFAPDNLDTAAAGDRPYAGALSVGAHTHFRWQGFDAALGADLVMTGSGTGLGNFQRGLHKVLGVDLPSENTLDNQISGGFHPTVVGELARDLTLVPGVYMRPFVEARAGAETMVRGGVDLTFGSVGRGTLSVREGVTGHRYRVVPANDAITGFSFLLGADVAHVSDSIFLPEDRGYDLTDSRERVRAGLHWQGEEASAFYGLTYLGEEFEAQSEGQIVGSIRINLSF